MLSREPFSRNWAEKKVILVATLAVAYVKQKFPARPGYRLASWVRNSSSAYLTLKTYQQQLIDSFNNGTEETVNF